MTEYISRDTAIARLTRLEVTDKLATMADAKREIADMPAADVAPVRHGTWLLIGADKRGRGGIFECSACNGCSPHKDPYCPKCGAKMDGKDGEAGV